MTDAARGSRCACRCIDGATSRCHPSATPNVSQARRILVVDDNEDAANTLAMILKLEGHEVDTAYSGAEALGRIEEYKPDVVLLDIGLPGLDGFAGGGAHPRAAEEPQCAPGRDYGIWHRKRIARARARRDSPVTW